MPLDLSKLPDAQRAHVEANSRWALIYPWSQNVEHPAGNFRVDEQFFSELQAFMEDHRGVYYTPFAANHDSPGPSPEGIPDDARNKGRVLDLRKAARGIEALIYFAKGLAQEFDEGRIDSLSPAHYTRGIKSPLTGKVYKTGLREVSSVLVRHLKNMPGASPWYQLDEQELGAQPLTSLAEEQEDMSTQDDKQGLTLEAVNKMIADAQAATDAKITKMSEALEALAKKPETTDNAEGEVTAEQRKIADLQRQLEEMRTKSALAEARAKVAARYPKLDEASATTLSEAVMSAGDKGAALLEAVSKIPVAAADSAVTVNAELGAPGNPAALPKGVTWASAMSEAVKAGHPDNSNAAILYISNKYPALMR